MVEESGRIEKQQTERWDYETHFGEYVRLLGRKGKESLESIDRFPKRIELDAQWHTALDKMRVDTKGDGKERYAVIGLREDSRDLYFPETAAIGEHNLISAPTIGNLRWEMWQKYRITSILGDVHTHPRGSAFSPTDLYGLLNRLTEPQPFMKGLANENENIFAFKTRETFLVSEIDTQQRGFSGVFKEHWLEKAGFKYNENRSHLIRTEPRADIWKANLGIATSHLIAWSFI